MELIERYRGAMMGLAAGDALGTTLEFTFQGRFEPVTDMVGGGRSALSLLIRFAAGFFPGVQVFWYLAVPGNILQERDQTPTLD